MVGLLERGRDATAAAAVALVLLLGGRADVDRPGSRWFVLSTTQQRTRGHRVRAGFAPGPAGHAGSVGSVRSSSEAEIAGLRPVYWLGACMGHALTWLLPCSLPGWLGIACSLSTVISRGTKAASGVTVRIGDA